MGKAARKKKQASLQTEKPSIKSPAACILEDFLYLGPVSSTSNAPFLLSKGISHVLSIGRSPVHLDITIETPNGFKQLTYTRLSLLDTPDSDIANCVEKACAVLDAAEKERTKVLIHCSAAISRSPTIVAAYLIKRRGKTLRDELEILVRTREAVAPNEGFMKQLRRMEVEILGIESLDGESARSRVRVGQYLRSELKVEWKDEDKEEEKLE